ncbi:mechanosensitive ion channel family protein [Georgenia alba]|uniref:Mechanosensitive ion channel family protein n=1 Tax=Georgenia alba TaxID=2233858 RepID=A0ABW2Q2X7_9MICO
MSGIFTQAGPVVEWFTSRTGDMFSALINVVVIILVALLARGVLGRVIVRMVDNIVRSHRKLDRARFNASRLVMRASGDEAARQKRQEQRAQTIGSVLRSIASFVIFGVAFLMVLSEFGINLGPVLASAGVLGLAIGFGAQSLVQDFLSGLFLMSEDQFGVGDSVDVGDAIGTVEAMTMRITKIRDLNGNLWYVRNGEILRVCNMSQDWSRALIEIPLDYSVNVPQATEVMENSLEEFATESEHGTDLLEKPVLAGVVGIGNGAVTMRVMIKTKPGAQFAVERAVRAHLKDRFDKEGIRIAIPVLPTIDGGAAKQG